MSTRRQHFATSQNSTDHFPLLQTPPSPSVFMFLSVCVQCDHQYFVAGLEWIFFFRRLYLGFLFPTTFYMTPYIGAQMSVLLTAYIGKPCWLLWCFKVFKRPLTSDLWSVQSRLFCHNLYFLTFYLSLLLPPLRNPDWIWFGAADVLILSAASWS